MRRRGVCGADRVAMIREPLESAGIDGRDALPCGVARPTPRLRNGEVPEAASPLPRRPGYGAIGCAMAASFRESSGRLFFALRHSALGLETARGVTGRCALTRAGQQVEDSGLSGGARGVTSPRAWCRRARDGGGEAGGRLPSIPSCAGWLASDSCWALRLLPLCATQFLLNPAALWRCRFCRSVGVRWAVFDLARWPRVSPCCRSHPVRPQQMQCVVTFGAETGQQPCVQHGHVVLDNCAPTVPRLPRCVVHAVCWA